MIPDVIILLIKVKEFSHLYAMTVSVKDLFYVYVHTFLSFKRAFSLGL